MFYLVTRVCGFANGYFSVRTSEPVRGNVFLHSMTAFNKLAPRTVGKREHKRGMYVYYCIIFCHRVILNGPARGGPCGC
ncbi:hypothetical protein KVY46_004000 [Escherichia coli]|nr:hypothetical protein [Escherichia coli]EFG3169438.1 hypothetical protein [Escherichia coli]EFK3947190.1 hypothetical protein [Escherichia coli]EFL0199137.1 hypothetical protein [Escherichia coli]EHS1737102.1 hypothetical protein [Escherichia coli]EJJ1317053.1 hypothetical protein [Escherichia coli]